MCEQDTNDCRIGCNLIDTSCELNLNDCKIGGRVGDEPKYGFTKSGTPKVCFSVGTHDYFVDEHGIKQQRTEWHHIAMFGSLVDVVRDLRISKGCVVLVSGSIKTHLSECKTDGTKRVQTEIIPWSLQLISRPFKPLPVK